MKLTKYYLAIIPLLASFLFVACDNDLNGVGGTVQPPSDGIAVTVDTLSANAKTISMQNSVYARTINGVLGKYNDEFFGEIKADYLAQFLYPDSAKFEDDFIGIDSVQFIIDFANFSGDSIAPMGLSVYEVNKPLVENFYTNVDPKGYYSEADLLLNQAFTVASTKITSSTSSTKFRAIIGKLDNSFGTRLHNAYKNKIIKDSESFNKFFKGVYVTTNFGSSTIINVLNTSVDIHYKYNDVKGNYNNTRDTIRTSRFSLTVTPEVIQLNSIKNTLPSELFTENTGSTYLKTPAGVYTEVVFPLKDIREDMASKNMVTVNSAQFYVNGYTQKESELKSVLDRPRNILLVNKDSIDDFFSKGKLYNNINSFAISRSASNTYNFENISRLINHYNDKGLDEVTYVLIPVDISIDSSTGAVLGVYNHLRPSTAILRSDPANMKLNLVYSRFNK